MSEPQQGARVRGEAQVARTGRFGEVVITKEALEGMVESLNSRPTPMNVEHDVTKPPIGRTISGRLVQLDEHNWAVEAEFELFGKTVEAQILSSTDLQRVDLDSLPSPAEHPLELGVDFRSYDRDEVARVADLAGGAGPVRAHDDYGRFSGVAEALLVIALGNLAVAGYWFAKGFFTRAGEEAGAAFGGEVGEDMLGVYRSFKRALRQLIERRKPADQPPLTMFAFDLDRPGGGAIEIEGSSRAEGESLERFLDAGSDLVRVARRVVASLGDPSRVSKIHFVWSERGWEVSYILDDDAEVLLLMIVSPEKYAELERMAERGELPAADEDLGPHSN